MTTMARHKSLSVLSSMRCSARTSIPCRHATTSRSKLDKFVRCLSSNASSNISFSVPVALRLLQACCVRMQQESVELILRCNLDPRKQNQSIRQVAHLPHGTGARVRIAVFAKGEKATQALQAGADLVGDTELVAQIQSGVLNFDRVLATPDCMSSVGKVARILGPRGLMPNPKLGTVTNDLAAAIQLAKAGSVEYRTDKAGIVHALCGKSSFTNQQLHANVDALVHSVLNAKPHGARGEFLLAAFLHSTHGPSIPLDLRQPPFKVNATAPMPQ